MAVIDEAVRGARRILVGANHQPLVVLTGRLGEDRAGIIELKQRSRIQPPAVVDAVGVDEESGNLLLEVNVSCLRAGGSRDSDYFPDAAVDVVNVGDERSAAVCGLAIVAGHLRQVVAAEQLVERCSWKIDRLEGVVVVDET